MISILLEDYDIDASWLYDEIKNYIKSGDVVVVASETAARGPLSLFVFPFGTW